MKFLKNKKNIFIRLKTNEQITFYFNRSNYDVIKKNWGLYISPSLQKRCLKAGFKAVIISKNKNSYVAFVHKKKIKLFIDFLKKENYKLKVWIYRSVHFSKYFN